MMLTITQSSTNQQQQHSPHSPYPAKATSPAPVLDNLASPAFFGSAYMLDLSEEAKAYLRSLETAESA